MAAIEVITGFTTAASSTETAITNTNSTTNTIRNFGMGRAFILDSWSNAQALSYVKIFSPRMHDNTNGFIYQVPDTAATYCITQGWPVGQPQEVFAQDTLSIKRTGSGTAGDIEQTAVMVYYEQFGDAKLITLKELNNRRQHILALRNSFTGTTDGSFTTGTAVSAVTSGDILKANTDYAILGASFSQSDVTNLGAHTLTITGPDTGNYPIGLPLMDRVSPNFFVNLAKMYDAPLVPVFNSANKGGTLLKVNNDENANTIVVTLYVAQLL